MTTQPKKKMLTPRFDVELVEKIDTDRRQRKLSRNEWMKNAAELFLEFDAIEETLDRGCEQYCKWHENGLDGYSEKNMAYHLYSLLRTSLALLRGEED